MPADRPPSGEPEVAPASLNTLRKRSVSATDFGIYRLNHEIALDIEKRLRAAHLLGGGGDDLARGPCRAFARELRRASAERALARRTTREALSAYREIAAERPELTGALRYQQVIARHTGADDEGARRLVERAESEFARWPIERPVRFRDIVQYLVVQRWLAVDPQAQGFLSRLTDIVAEEIPEEL